MAIEHFAALLDDVLNGKTSALLLWTSYTVNKQFNEEEINLALQKIKELSLGDTPQKSHALNLRAFMHENAQGGPQDYPEAIRLYDQAIKLGNAVAMNNRAFMHKKAQGGPQNYPEAIRLYEEAIKLGNPRAMNNRAFMHKYAQGGPQNYPEAIRLYEKAIKLGFASAMNNRAFMHKYAQGGPQNYPEAIRLYENAIKLRSTEAMYNRASMHAQGVGGPVNKFAAICLYNKAFQLGFSDAKSQIELLLQTEITQINGLVQKLKNTSNDIPQDGDTPLALSSSSLANTLEKQTKDFFNNPSIQQNLTCREQCEAALLAVQNQPGHEKINPIVQEILAVITRLGRMIRLESPAEKEFTIGAARGFFYKVGLVADAGETHLASYLTRLDAAKLVLATKAASDTAKIRYAEHPEANDSLYAKPVSVL